MKLWLSKNGEIPLREQLTRQIVLAIASGDLKTGDKLPSLRELAIRFKIHQNTVSKAYLWLEENGWVVSRRGSGVFVLPIEAEKRRSMQQEKSDDLNDLISQFFRNTQSLGYTSEQIRAGLERHLSKPLPETIVVVEPVDSLREILLTEIKDNVNASAVGLSIEDFDYEKIGCKSLIIAVSETAEILRKEFPKIEITVIKFNSAQNELKGRQKPSPESLIGIASGFVLFRLWAQTFLLAVGIPAESLIIRDTADENFLNGLHSCVFVIADSATEKLLPAKLEKRIFRLISEDSINELRLKFGR